MKIIKRSMSVIISIVMIVFMLSFSTAHAEDTIMFSGGNGTEESPYLISKKEDLIQLSSLIHNNDTAPLYYTKYYKQINDIDMENEPFEPIGRWTNERTYDIFGGTYDGNYHKIVNLYVNKECVTGCEGRAGLFNLIGGDGSAIKNLSVYGDIIGSAESGGIAGVSHGCTITNCSFNGNINGQEGFCGGVVGQIWRCGEISNCYSNATINCGEKNYIGGIVGLAVAGYEESVQKIIISNCYAIGIIKTKSSENVGGIVGSKILKNDESTIIFKNCYYLSTMADGAVQNQKEEGCYRLSEKALKNCADGSLLGTPFVNNERTDDFNDGFPVFEWQNYILFNGSGTEDDPYQINNKEELKRMRDYVNSVYLNPTFGYAHYIQMNDIDLENEEWTPIGKTMKNGEIYAYGSFCGLYNGNHNKIKNLKIGEGVDRFWGLFGSLRKGGIIENIEVYGDINTKGDSVGGIVGEICDANGVVRNCCFIGDVIGQNKVGGILGLGYEKSSVSNCYQNGIVKATNEAVGFAGGVVGKLDLGNDHFSDSSIVNCYHVGKVNGTGGNMGSILGYGIIRDKGGEIKIKNCYALHDDCELTANGNITQKDILVYSSSVFRIIAEDISSEFTTNNDKNFNNGYPIFYWQAESKNSGDINNDGQINVADAVLLKKHILNIAPIKKEQAFAADINQDNVIDVFDMISLRKMLLENKER